MKKINFNLLIPLLMMHLLFLVFGILGAFGFKNINILLFFNILPSILVVIMTKGIMHSQLISRKTRKTTLTYIYTYLIIYTLLTSIIFYFIFNELNVSILNDIPNFLRTKNIWIHLFYLVFQQFIVYSLSAMWTYHWDRHTKKENVYIWITVGITGLILLYFIFIESIAYRVYDIALPLCLIASIPLCLYSYHKNQTINLV